MTQTAVEAIGQLRAVMEGPVIEPGDPGFDDGRRVWNGGIDRRPAVIARCASAADVAAAVQYAREHGLEVSVRGGAHNPAGTAVCDGGLMIDLSLLNHVAVDPDARRATAGGGALLADLDAAAQAHGLAVPAALCAPPRTDTSSPCSRAYVTAAATSAAEAHRAITAGRRSIPAFHTRRASSKPGSPGSITGPSITARSRPIASPAVCVCVITIPPPERELRSPRPADPGEGRLAEMRRSHEAKPSRPLTSGASPGRS